MNANELLRRVKTLPPRELRPVPALRIASIAILLAALSAGVAARQNEKGEPMQGTWTCLSATVDGKPLAEGTVKLLRLTLTTNRYKTERGTEVLFDSEYTLEASQSPAHIDIVGTEGDFKGRSARGIYSLAGEKLKICYTMPGKARPTAFASPPGSGAYLIVWKRQPSSNKPAAGND
jgi:uncharacterized protein (TIGR03067 family)